MNSFDECLFAFFNANSDEYEAGMDQNGYFQTVYAVADPLNDYLTVDLKAIKEQYGFVKLIAIKASAYNTNAMVTKITVAKTEGGSEEPEEPQGPVELTFDEEGKAYIYPADMQVEGMTIDRETGVLTKAVAGQAAKLGHISNLYYTQPCVKLAQALCERSGLAAAFSLLTLLLIQFISNRGEPVAAQDAQEAKDKDSAKAAGPVVKAPAPSSESELDIMVED